MNSEGSQSSLTDVEGGKHQTTRRKFFLGAGAAVGLAALALRMASAEVVEHAEDPGLREAGVAHSIELPNALHIAAPQNPLAIYDAIWRDRAAALADFEIGSYVFGEGQPEGGVNLSRIDATGGAIRLIPESRWFVDENPHGTEVRMGDPVVRAVGKKRA